jgi:ABC-2 type transport system ATP-binding protein
MGKRLTVENLYYQIPFGESIIENLSFQLDGAIFYGLLGKNGAGKTTLVDLIMGNRPVTKGTIQVLGEDPISFNRSNTHRVASLSQEVSLKGNITIAQFLKFHSELFDGYSLEEEMRLCDYFDLDVKMKIGALSTGQQKKVQIVAGLACMPELLLVDEITAVLDPEARAQFFELLLRHRTEYGTSILLATNIAEDLIGRADKVLFLSDGKGEEFDPKDINKLFNLDIAQ